jgi:pimeloyl-ACP methyl ester carboxylesterase
MTNRAWSSSVDNAALEDGAQDRFGHEAPDEDDYDYILLLDYSASGREPRTREWLVRVDVEGIGIEFSVAGQGRPVVLLHGFPDTRTLWRNQVPALVAAGFQVITPDLRGYGSSDKPTGVDAYLVPYLAGDILAVLDDLGHRRAHVVGHDWGSGVAWSLAAFAPERVDHLVAMSVGHPMALANAGLAQREKSWYMLLFQFEGVAERWLTKDNWANFRAWSRHPEADAVITQLERDRSLTPALNYYRANLQPEALVEGSVRVPSVTVPTMGMWSSNDIALLEEQMTESAKFVAGTFRCERMDGAGHWMQVEQPEAVNRLLIDFLPS